MLVLKACIKARAALAELKQVLFEQPYCRIANLTEKNIVQRQTVVV